MDDADPGGHPSKLIITEDTPLTAWFGELVFNYLHIETEALHSWGIGPGTVPYQVTHKATEALAIGTGFTPAAQLGRWQHRNPTSLLHIPPTPELESIVNRIFTFAYISWAKY